MYIFHNTDIVSLMNILKDGYIKSYSLLKKEGKTDIHGEGSGIYTENKFIYFSCIDKLLFNKSFYVSNLHSSTPNILSEWFVKKIKMYKRKYNKNYPKYNLVLKKLFDIV